MEEGEITDTDRQSDTEYAQYCILPIERPTNSFDLASMTGEQYLGWVQQERSRLPRVKSVNVAVEAAKQRLRPAEMASFAWNPDFNPIIEQFYEIREQLGDIQEGEVEKEIPLSEAPQATLLMSLSEAECLRLINQIISQIPHHEAWPYYLACRLSHPPHTPAVICALRRLADSQDHRFKVIIAGVFGQLDLIN